MSCQPARDPTPSRIDSSASNANVPETEIAYFERRLGETEIRAVAAAGTCSHASHAGLAELYQLALSELRAVPVVTIAASPLLEQAREAGVIK